MNGFSYKTKFFNGPVKASSYPFDHGSPQFNPQYHLIPDIVCAQVQHSTSSHRWIFGSTRFRVKTVKKTQYFD